MSPMPFGCVPIRQCARNPEAFKEWTVSNAFRLCAYPAANPIQ